MTDMQIDVEVMKADMRSMSTALTQMGVKMDSMLAMQTQLVRLQSEQDNARSAMDRAFTNIREVETRADSTEAKVNQSLSFIRGALFVSALVFSGLQWYVIKQIENVSKANDTLAAVDRRVFTLEARLYPDTNGRPK